jgi:hypothetical protein
MAARTRVPGEVPQKKNPCLCVGVSQRSTSSFALSKQNLLSTLGTALQVPPCHILVRKVFSMPKKGQQYTTMTDKVHLVLVRYKKDHPGAT